MTLLKSKSEEKGDTLLRVMQRGKASLREAAILLDKSWPTIKAHADLGKIETVNMGKRLYVTIPVLVQHGLVLPSLPEFSERMKQLLVGIDPNLDDLGANYD
jgi:hypothetical protein